MSKHTASDPPADLLDQLVADWKTERPDLDASSMQIVGRIINLGGKLRASANHALKPYDIHYTDLDVLATLRRSGAPYRMTPTELSRSVLLTSGAMTAALRRLEKKELVARAPAQHDGRVLTVVLTPKGLNLIDKVIAVRFEEADQVTSSLSKSDRKMLGDLLRKLSVATD